jgi:hypothetical protein
MEMRMKRQVLSPTMKYSEEADLAPSPRDGLAASLPCIISEITQSQFSKSAVIYLHSLDAGASAYPLRPGLFVHDNTRVSGMIRSQPPSCQEHRYAPGISQCSNAAKGFFSVTIQTVHGFQSHAPLHLTRFQFWPHKIRAFTTESPTIFIRVHASA